VDETENVKASTAAFTTFTPFRSWLSRQLERLPLIGAVTAEREVRKRKFLHHAYFVRLSPRHFKRVGLPTDGPLKNGALLFLSAFNGDSEAYFRGFSNDLHAPMDQIWKHCVDWETARVFDNLQRFITRYRRRVTMFYNVYEDTSTVVRESLLVREALDETLRLASSGASDAEFQRAYRRLAQVAWGTPREEES
jgi:hypothetical protein